MPDNKKKVVASKKETVDMKRSKTSKKSTTNTKNVKTEVVVTPKKITVSKENGNKKTTTSKPNLSKVTGSNKTKVSNNKKKVTSKDTKKKNTTKKVAKFSTIQGIKEESKEELITPFAKIDKKKNEKNKKVDLAKIDVFKTKGMTERIKKTSKSNFFVAIKDKLKLRNKKKNFKFLKDKKQGKFKEKKLQTKQKVESVKDAPLFTTKTKKWLIVVVIICAIIIITEVAYLIYHQIDVDRHTTYYDSLNSLVIDNTDIVAVGSSNFKHSKYNDYTRGFEKAKFVKYDKNGKVIFEKMYEKGINTTFSSIISVNDGYIIVGSGEFSEEEQKNEGREAIIIKYDKEGNIVWEKYYQVVTNTRFNKVIATSDGYVAIGQSIYANMEMGNHTTGGGIIVKYDFDGNEVWHNNHGGMKSGNFNDIVEVNSDFYVVGKDATDSANVVKYDKNGEYKWHKNYSYTDGIGFTGITYLDNALYVVGSKKILPEDTDDDDNRDTTNTDALLVKYDLNGKILFEKNFGGSNYERYNSILAYRNNLYIVGHTTSTDAGLKINTDGELMTGMLVRYDKDGNILKKESFGGSNNDNLTDIVTDSVSLYISAYSNSEDGNITTAKNNGKDYFGKVIKLDFKFRTLMVK